VQIGTDTDWEMVSVGNDHTLATKDDGSLWTWGDPVSGKLGNGSFVNEEDEPVEIQPGTTWSRVSAGGATTSPRVTWAAPSAAAWPAS